MSELVQRLHHRCREDGDCLIWTGRRSAGGVPRLGDASLRRLVYIDAKGPIQDRFMVTYTCGNSLCINPEHLKATTKSAVLKRTYETTDLALRRSITSTREARKKAKLSLEAAREIRASNETIKELGARYGVHPTLISFVRRGEAWKEPVTPFTGLGARA
ncbi:hypothetical protein [Variovorax sp. 160MFSha2.1]|uniref:hypothetical protein n=1 Tax=Variovorax sp. 160MFSha2.1 TaxID=3158367 RepID=UPI003AAB86F2